MNAALFGEGFFNLIPSFYRTLMYLKKQKREFSVVFRQFGSREVENICYEWNRFCAGEHPAFNGRNNQPLVKFDGSKNCKELRFRSPCQTGMMYRQNSTDAGDIMMVTGNHQRVELITDLNLIQDEEVQIHRESLDIF